MPVKAMAMPYLLQVSMTWSSRMEPPGCGDVADTPLRWARSMLSPKGKKASLPSGHAGDAGQTMPASPSARQRLRAHGEEVLPNAVAQHVLYSSERYTSMVLSRSERRM